MLCLTSALTRRVKSKFEVQTLFLVSETRVLFYSSKYFSLIMPEKSKNESFSYIFETSSLSEIVSYDRANQLMIMQMDKMQGYCSFYCCLFMPHFNTNKARI